MISIPRRMAFLVTLAGFAISPISAADKPAVTDKALAKPAATKFMRIQRDAVDEPTSLDTAVVRYVPATGVGGLTVDLVGVVHVGDKAYYEKLNKLFDQYDVVLYELVAPSGSRPPKGGQRDPGNPLALLQLVMQGVLDLESQMEHIDYTKKNFVHADLSFDDLGKAMRERGETGLTLALNILADVLRQQNLAKQKPAKAAPGKPQGPPDDIFATLLDPQAPVKLKFMLAQQFEDLGNPAAGLGQALNTLLISDRNAAAMKVLHQEVDKGKKKIAIFYGAAHMPDFEKRLQAELGLKRDSEKWLIAWDLQPRPRNVEDLLRKLLK
jgi:hypothetical protein